MMEFTNEFKDAVNSGILTTAQHPKACQTILLLVANDKVAYWVVAEYSEEYETAQPVGIEDEDFFNWNTGKGQKYPEDGFEIIGWLPTPSPSGQITCDIENPVKEHLTILDYQKAEVIAEDRFIKWRATRAGNHHFCRGCKSQTAPSRANRQMQYCENCTQEKRQELAKVK